MSRFSNKNAKVEALARVGIFAGFTKTDLGLLARYTTEVTVPEGEVLVREGHVGQQLLYIESGEVLVKRKGKVLATLKRGDVVGELSLIDGKPAIADVVVSKNLVALVMGIQDFQSLMAQSSTFENKLLKAVVARLREADKALAG